MIIRTLLVVLLAGILVWDFVTVGPMNATITRASERAAVAYNELRVWAIDRTNDREVQAYLKKTATAAQAAVQDLLEQEQTAATVATVTLENEEMSDEATDEPATAITEPPMALDLPSEMLALAEQDLSIEADFGDSVFSRKAVNAFIKEVSAETNVSSAYLKHLAERESAFDPVAEAGTSSASGLYQFTESTWLELFKRHAPSHGDEKAALAQHIMIASNGRPSVASNRRKRRILTLRFDPKFSTFMAAHYTNEQEAFLKRRLGRDPSYAELYIAHFLGAGGAAKLFIANVERPNDSAVELFPAAARANRRFFYDKDGNGVTIAKLYENLLELCEDLVGQTA